MVERNSDQNNALDGREVPAHSISTSNEDQNQKNTTSSVNLSTTESQDLSEAKPEVQFSYNKNGKCRLHDQIGNTTVGKRSVGVKKKGGVNKRVCEALCATTFSKNASTFRFFGIVGEMCASSRYQSFRTQLNLLTATPCSFFL